MIYNVADDAQLFASDLAKGTVEGVDAASSALRGVVVEAGSSATERLLRQALAPVHDYWTSVMRVQAAVDEEQAALPPPPRSATVGGESCVCCVCMACKKVLDVVGRTKAADGFQQVVLVNRASGYNARVSLRTWNCVRRRLVSRAMNYVRCNCDGFGRASQEGRVGDVAKL